MKFIDLFSGIGGYRVALEKFGHECVFANDINSMSNECYYANFKMLPDTREIRKIDVSEIPAHDILCAGLQFQPMAANSNIQKQPLFDVLRIAEHHKPKVILIDAVRNFETLAGGKAAEQLEAGLSKIGYNVRKSFLQATDFGLPYYHKHIYYVALLRTARLSFAFPAPQGKVVYLPEILEAQVDPGLYIERDDITFDIQPSAVMPAQKRIRVGQVGKGYAGERIYSSKGIAVTLAPKSGGIGARTGLYDVDGRIRRLSLTECKRLMGLPDKHIVSGGLSGYAQIASAAVVPIVEAIVGNIKGL